MKKNWSVEELREKVEKLGPWYHKIDLGQGVITPGPEYEMDWVWDQIRETRKSIDYNGKKVLDLGTLEGLWAFEAERLGAKLVVATDCLYKAIEKFLFCREVLDSKVMPFFSVPPYKLWERLDSFIQDATSPRHNLFDIVQHLGLLYHQRDPLLSLSQSRSVLRTGGYLLIETEAIEDEERPYLLFNGIPQKEPKEEYWFRISKDVSTWWAPTIPCLKEMLKATLFEPIEETLHSSHRLAPTKEKSSSKSIKYTRSRVCLVARAVGGEDVDIEHFKELCRSFRNPGLDLYYL